MKKLLYYAAALAMAFFSASCQQENLEPVQESTAVTFTVEAPTAIQTKAIADGQNVDELVYEVWLTPNIGKLDGAQKLYRSTTPMKVEGGVNKATLSLDLVNDQKFAVLFWAQKSGTYVYNTEELTNVYYNNKAADAYAANDDRLAAFYAVAYVNDCQHVTAQGEATGSQVTLTRPFAQVNLGTINTSTELGSTTGYTIVVEQSNMILENVPTAFNVFSSEVSDYKTIQFKMHDVPCKDLTSADAKLPGFENPSYWYAGMNYVFASKNKNVKLTYNIKTKLNGGMESTVTNTVYNVPLRENYRTNIIGNLLTSDTDYEIVVDADFSTNSNSGTTVVISEGIVQNQNGDYEITNAKGFAYMVNNLWVDENGAANDATFYVHPGEYDLAGIDFNSVNVTSGTLKVYNQVPVVTRSASEGAVVIKGLKKPLINVVSTGATVLFSGIIINEFEGTAAAALVNDNQGKVILSGCEIRDTNADTILVGGKAPETVGGEEGGEEVTPELVYTAEQLKAAFENTEIASIGLGTDIGVEAPVVLPEDREVSLDLRGRELTIADPTKVSGTYAINNHGTLTIKDSYGIGEVKARGIYNGYVKAGDPISTARLIIEGGTFNAMGTDDGAAVFNYGLVEINGGKFASNGGYGLNNQSGATMIVNNADVRGGIYNCGTLEVKDSEVYQHLSGKHAIYNWTGSVTIESGEFDSESGNELIFADGENASVTINGGKFHKTAKSWLYAAATDKNITFVINGGTHYGYVNEPEMTVDPIRPYNDPIVVFGGSYNFDPTAWCDTDSKVVKDQVTGLWTVVQKTYVAQVGEVKYESVQDAVDAAENGATLIFLADVEQTDGVLITDKNITVDLDEKTFTVTNGANTNNRNFKINGSSEVTIMNGTMVAAGEYSSGAYGTVRTEGTANVTLEDLVLYNYRGNGLNVKALSGTTVTISNTEIYSEYGGGVEAAGGTVELTDVKVEQKGMYTAPYNSMAISVNGGGTVTVQSGTYSTECLTAEEANNQGRSHGPWCAGVLNSGGTLIINGGTFSNDNFGDDALATAARGLLLADTGAKIEIYDGTFNALKKVVDIQNNLGDASKNPTAILYGGDYSSDPLTWEGLISVAEGCIVKENNGRYTIEEYVPAAMVGNTEYGSIEDAIANWTNNTTLTLLTDVTLSDVVTLKSTEHHILDLGTYTMTAASGKNAIEIKAYGTGASERTAITIKADSNNPGGIDAGTKSIVYYDFAKGEATGDDRPIIKIESGVFTGGTSSYGASAGIYFKGGSAARQAATLNISGGTFHCAINGQSKSKLIITGGLFHYSVGSQGDSTANRLISGGTFKTFGFMTADSNNTKFWFGTSMGNSNVGLYINDDNYLVVGGPVITEFDDRFEAKAKIDAWGSSSYLKYSSAANGIYYTKKNNIKKSDHILELNPNKTFE